MAATRARAKLEESRTPGERVVATIQRGEADGNIAEIIRAIGARVESGNVALRWRITLDDLDVTEDDLTLDEAFLCEEAIGAGWDVLNPTKSAGHLRGLLLVLFETRGAMSPAEAAARVKRIKLTDIGQIVSHYEPESPPKDS